MNRKIIWIIIGVIILAAVIGYVILTKNQSAPSTYNTKSSPQTESSQDSNQSTQTQQSAAQSSSSAVVWQQTENGWMAIGTPPECSSSIDPPVDISIVTSILYPGQTRGGNYKPHGGFRFDNQKSNDVVVTSPLTGTVVQMGQYLVDGEIQYTFDFIEPCGTMHRLGHLRELTPKFAQLVQKLPAAQEGDSRTQTVDPPVEVKLGEEIATKIGITADTNVFVDWGVYNLLSKNEASQNSTWAAGHPSDLEQHAVCWFDLLSPQNNTKVRALPPGDPGSGTNSDYCK